MLSNPRLYILTGGINRLRIYGISTYYNNIIDVAEVVLDKCMVTDPKIKDPGDIDFTVIMNYEFLEDFAIPTNRM